MPTYKQAKMNKISLIIKREYLTRVKKKSFIVMTLIGPLMIALLMLSPILIDHFSKSTPKTIAVLDESKLFFDKFKEHDNVKYRYVFDDLQSEKDSLLGSNGDFALIYIPATQLNLPGKAVIYSKSQVPMDVTSYVKRVMSREIETTKMAASGIDPEILRSIKATVHIENVKIAVGDDQGTIKEQKSHSAINYAIGMAAGFFIYISIFVFGSQVLRGVLEEKTNRIIEVIISSVKPFQLMMGKILGLSLVGLTQFALWIILSVGIYAGFSNYYGPQGVTQQVQMAQTMNPQAQEVMAAANDGGLTEKFTEIVDSLPITNIILAFLFFFVFGFLIYGALFAAIGSAVDNETDTQQFMLPITVPLIIAFISLTSVLQNPDSTISLVLSLFPLTSPIVMMGRIAGGVPAWELATSMALLVLGFIGVTWLSAKIYRTGILMYGKKVNYKELWKWIRYHN